jgi:hypothetical protein
VRKIIVAATLFAAFATPAIATVNFTSMMGAPDPGPFAGQMIVEDFTNPLPAGYSWSGSLLTAIGSSPAAAAPAGNLTRYGYVTGSVASPGVATLDTPSLKSISFYWGSIDLYNKVEVLGAGGEVLFTVMGGDFSAADGNRLAPGTNRRVSFNKGTGPAISGLRVTTTGIAFEFDDFAAAAVPEPATWAMLIAGFGLVGFAMRRQRGIANVSA